MRGFVMALIALVTLAFMSVPVAADRLRSIPSMAIDIGSYTTRLGMVTDSDQPQLISVSPGILSVPGPTYSAWTPEGFLFTPDGTDENLFVHPFNTIFNLKHPVAFSRKDTSATRPKITGYQAWTLQDITAKYLKKLQSSGEQIIGQKIANLALVKPANMDPKEGERIRHDAIRSAIHDVYPNVAWSSLYTKSVMSSYLFNNGVDEVRNLLIYHLGGSTFGVTVVERDDGIHDTLSSIHDPDLGGRDFSQRLVNHLILAHEKRTSQDLSRDDKFMKRLGHEVEKAKQSLSSQNAVRIEIESPSSSNSAFKSRNIFSERLSRSQFEELNRDLFEKTISAVDQALLKANMSKEAIQDIVLSGGSARIPFIRKVLREYFADGDWPKEYLGWDRPETTALFGAAKIGHWYMNSEEGGICCFDSSPLSVGIETTGGLMLRFADEMSDRTIYKTVDFSTATDNQDRVVIRVFEGQRALTKENKFLGQMEFSGITPAPKGVARIRVKMEASTCGNALHLTVMDVTTRRVERMSISPRSAFEDDLDGIERMKEEALPFEHMDTAIWEFAEMAGTNALLDPA
ncbi:hypothetical protein EMPS_04266 [Entomortierella parvispora]|uniref:Hsp70 family protein n=1 Tax=Entomortierella parvispora TaxID=205924 RepID=A0A9P3H869_9FUNG|nr:hypothetical protein EMPS_04266 [Entomortierella parvispora]